MAAMMVAARQGRELQRYSASTGGRIVVGCIPYRVRDDNGEVEVLVICSRKKGASAGVLFPKGGWELDESMDEAARREALEEAGVRGETGPSLGRWCYQSRSYEATYEGYMFPLRVTDELERWPEMSGRGRTWVTVQDAMDRCPHLWMREALQRFADRVADAAL
ncbi:nudix hydrolase 21, chloroplastic [Triticum aestivum]|uniref:nudix hydrolase 21, chloroplastic n=1 Tax=Triticum aestivum TaxID=4565 RepID=UPI001D032F3D|nr:nudix hydrolase 21, chloroplastic-like [Triticum aestivum]